MNKADAVSKLKTFAPALKATGGGTGLFLYGSTARGEASFASDIDVFLDIDPSGPFNALDLVAAKRLLEEGLGMRVDLTTRRGLHPLIRKGIEQQAERVF